MDHVYPICFCLFIYGQGLDTPKFLAGSHLTEDKLTREKPTEVQYHVYLIYT